MMAPQYHLHFFSPVFSLAHVNATSPRSGHETPHHRQTPWASEQVRSRWTERRECPRYFFHVIDGHEMLDTVGTVLAGGSAGRSHRGLRRDAEGLGRHVLEQRPMAS